jgi:hypothetical protein
MCFNLSRISVVFIFDFSSLSWIVLLREVLSSITLEVFGGMSVQDSLVVIEHSIASLSRHLLFGSVIIEVNRFD